MTLPDDSRVLGHLLGSASVGASGACLDDGAISAWAEGRLDERREGAVERHLASCDACRRLATDVRSLLAEERAASTAAPEAPIASLEAARARRVRRGAWALAASILVAVGAGIAALASRGGGPRGEGSVDERLVAAAHDLRDRAPSVFGGFEPVGPAERRSAERDVSRAGLAVRSPAGIVLDERPTIEWTGGAGATAFDVLLAGPDGSELWRRRATGLALEFPKDAPALTAGTAYVVEVSAVGGAADGARATRGFRLASAPDAAAWRAAVAEVERRAPSDLRALLLAHAAARRGLLLEADARAGDALSAGGAGGDVARETRAWVRARLGWADDAGPGATDGR